MGLETRIYVMGYSDGHGDEDFIWHEDRDEFDKAHALILNPGGWAHVSGINETTLADLGLDERANDEAVDNAIRARPELWRPFVGEYAEQSMAHSARDEERRLRGIAKRNRLTVPKDADLNDILDVVRDAGKLDG